MISFQLDNRPYVAVLEIYQPPSEDDKRAYNTQHGTKLFTVIVEGYSTKKLEEKIGLLQQAVTHQGWAIGPQ
jgi:hypothetical protein